MYLEDEGKTVWTNKANESGKFPKGGPKISNNFTAFCHHKPNCIGVESRAQDSEMPFWPDVPSQPLWSAARRKPVSHAQEKLPSAFLHWCAQPPLCSKHSSTSEQNQKGESSSHMNTSIFAVQQDPGNQHILRHIVNKHQIVMNLFSQYILLTCTCCTTSIKLKTQSTAALEWPNAVGTDMTTGWRHLNALINIWNTKWDLILTPKNHSSWKLCSWKQKKLLHNKHLFVQQALKFLSLYPKGIWIKGLQTQGLGQKPTQLICSIEREMNKVPEQVSSSELSWNPCLHEQVKEPSVLVQIWSHVAEPELHSSTSTKARQKPEHNCAQTQLKQVCESQAVLWQE